MRRTIDPIAARIVAAYKIALAENTANRNSLWQQIEEGHHGRFLSCLQSQDPAAVAGYLDNLFYEGILHGIDQSGDQTELIAAGRGPYLAHCMDRLVALAEALGCVPVENPEQGRWGKNMYLDPNELVDRIEAVLGIDITPPEVAEGRFGLENKEGTFRVSGY